MTMDTKIKGWWENLEQQERELLIAMLFYMDGEDFREHGVMISSSGEYMSNSVERGV